MAVTETIQQILQGIDNSQYGRDMRQYIHKGIQKCYEEGSAGETDLVARDAIEDIASSLGENITSLVADKGYSRGDIFVYQNQTYRATESIIINTQMVVGDNIEVTNLADEIGEIGRETFSYHENYSFSASTNWNVVKTISLNTGIYLIQAYVDFDSETTNGKVGAGFDYTNDVYKPNMARSIRGGNGAAKTAISLVSFYESLNSENVYLKVLNENKAGSGSCSINVLKIR